MTHGLENQNNKRVGQIGLTMLVVVAKSPVVYRPWTHYPPLTSASRFGRAYPLDEDERHPSRLRPSMYDTACPNTLYF